MLQPNKLSRNFLLHTQAQDVTEDLFKVTKPETSFYDENNKCHFVSVVFFIFFQIAWQVAKRGHRVLFIVAKPLQRLPVDENDPLAPQLLDGNIIRNIIFKYTSQTDEFMNILLEINLSRVKPRLIIVDFLHTFFSDLDNLPSANLKQDLFDNFIRKHMLIVALIQHSVNNLMKFMKKECFSVVCIDVLSNKVYDKFVQSIVDQYYFKKNVIFDSSSVLLKWFETNAIQ